MADVVRDQTRGLDVEVEDGTGVKSVPDILMAFTNRPGAMHAKAKLYGEVRVIRKLRGPVFSVGVFPGGLEICNNSVDLCVKIRLRHRLRATGSNNDARNYKCRLEMFQHVIPL